MEETDFNKVKAFLKAALTELKKGGLGHDQVSSSLAYYGGPSDPCIIATIEEAIENLISDVEISKKKWETEDEEENMKTCSICGNKFYEDADECPHCGENQNENQ